MTLTVGSLFSGIGGNDLGFERAGMRTLWQVELDPWCREVLAEHWPTVERFADVRDCGAGNLRPVDVICGGFPCQDISVAGRGAGISGAQSGLWGEFYRVVRELRPRYVVVENSPALKARGLGVVLGDLASIGYDAEWDCIPASAVGAPHERDRIWIVAYPGSAGGQQESRSSRPDEAADEAQHDHVAERDGQGDRPWPLADAASLGRGQGGPRRPSGGGAGATEPAQRVFVRAPAQVRWPDEPRLPRMVDGVPYWLDRTRATGNASVPQVAEYIGRAILEAEGISSV